MDALLPCQGGMYALHPTAAALREPSTPPPGGTGEAEGNLGHIPSTGGNGATKAVHRGEAANLTDGPMVRRIDIHTSNVVCLFCFFSVFFSLHPFSIFFSFFFLNEIENQTLNQWPNFDTIISGNQTPCPIYGTVTRSTS
jgi:hypothetical protein